MEKIKQELRSLIGESIILFQRYEYTFKSLLTISLIEGSAESLKNNFNNRTQTINKKSLGQLVRQYLAEIVDPTESSVRDDSGVHSDHITMRFSIKTSSISKADIAAKYKTLVDDRNFVVHQLISGLVPDDETSYKLMISRLIDINEKFERDLQGLIHIRQVLLNTYNNVLISNDLLSKSGH